MDLRLDGKVAVLTGASAGLGARFARILYDAGAHVVLAARRVDALYALANELGERAEAVGCDLSEAGDRERLVEIANAHGRIDLLVNNAGTARARPAEREALDDIRRTLEVNLVAAFHLCQLAAPQLAGGGVVVNIASLIAYRSADRFGLGSYAASKAGLTALTRELAAQWGRRGIRVNAIAPGWFPSEMNGMLADPDQVVWIEEHTALGRPGASHELDGALLFLASDASSYMTGQTLIVDGGWSAY